MKDKSSFFLVLLAAVGLIAIVQAVITCTPSPSYGCPGQCTGCSTTYRTCSATTSCTYNPQSCYGGYSTSYTYCYYYYYTYCGYYYSCGWWGWSRCCRTYYVYVYAYSTTCSRGAACGTGTCTSCPSNRYGSQCNNVCSCNGSPCSSGISGNGACYCNSGYVGCNCQYTAANSCSSHGSIGASGCGYYCSCYSGWAGTNCASCAANYYPSGSCTTYCVGSSTCSGHGSCSSVGSCSCDSGWSGSSCNACATYYYPAGVCNVYCNPGSTCSSHGSCTSTGSCSCSTGWSGTSCNACASGYYGSTCAACPGGASNPCSGYGSCSQGVSGSGACSCNSGYAGNACQYSDAVTCSAHGSAQSSGSCICSAGYAGANCNSCAGNYYSYSTCRYCLASSTCSGHGQCNGSGLCNCNTGFTGTSCNSCAAGYFDYPICVACSNSVTCNNRGFCLSDGSCSCNSGVTTAATTTGRSYCDACLSGYFASLASSTCARCPGPLSGAIQPCWGLGTCSEGIGGAGTCSCNTGYSGTACVDPVVGSLSPRTSIPTAGGTVLYISGYFLECDNTRHSNCFSAVSTVTVGGVNCVITSRSASSIQCTSPASTPATNYEAQVTLTRGDNIGVSAGTIEFARPVLTGLSPVAGPVMGESPYITLSGINFGASGGSVVFSSVGTQTGSSIVSWTHNQIVVKKPVGMGATSVSMSNAGVSSAARTFTYDAATVSSYSAGPFPTQAGSQMTITGLNFGTPSTPGSLTTLVATVGGRAASLVSRGDTQIVLTVPDGVVVQTLALTVGSNPVIQRAVSFLPPTIIGIFSGAGGCENFVSSGGFNTVKNCNPAGGDIITVVGTNFGPSAGAQNTAAALTITIRDSPCVVTSMTPHTHAVCTTSAGFGKRQPVTMSRGTAQVSVNTNGLFSYRSPEIYPGTLKFSPTLQSAVKLQSRATLQLNPVTIQTLDTFTARVVDFEGEQFCAVGGCNINDLTVTYGPLEDRLKYNCTVAAIDYSDTAIKCTTGPGVGGNLHFTVKLTSMGQSDPGADTFEYPEPTVTNNTLHIVGQPVPGDGVVLSSTTLGDLIQFGGTNFGTSISDILITYGQAEPWETATCYVEYVDDQQVRCRTIPGTGTDWHFKIWVGAGSSNQTAVGLGDAYNYKAAPRVDSVHTNGGCEDANGATTNCPTDGITPAGQRVRLTLRGANFGGDTTMQIQLGQLSCTNMLINASIPDAEVTCDLPAGVGTPAMVLSRLEGGAVYSSPYMLITYSAPVITSVSGCENIGNDTENCDRVGGQTLTFRGTNFGLVANNPPQILVGGAPCTEVVQTSDEEVTCVSGSGTLTQLVVILIQNGGGFRSNSDRFVSYRPCAAGTVAFTGEIVCRPCVAGKYSGLAGLAECIDCDSGTYSLEAAISCTKCALGMYSPDLGLGACLTCPAGSYADTTGSISCILTTPGFFTADGAAEPVPCEVGFYSSSGNASECTPCEAGKASAFSGQSSCPSCSTGKYNSFLAQTACINCPVGRFADTFGQTGCSECTQGYYTDLIGVRRCSLCPRGLYQPDAGKSFCVRCQPGKFQDQMASTDCQNCSSGTYSDAVGRAQSCTLCAAGTFQPDEMSLSCDICPSGKYQDQFGSTNCTVCPVGKYQNSAGKQSCDECAPGFYTNETTQTACVPCTPGRVSEFGVSSGASACVDCTTGRYALASGLAECNACSPGKFTNASATVDCISCPLGTFSDDTGTVTCEACPPGSFGPTSNLLQCQSCMLGRFQNESSQISCVACPDGKYQASIGQTDCVDCYPGFFSFSDNSGNAVCSGCPSGTFQNQSGTTSCVFCEAGKFSRFNYEFGTVSCAECPVGYFSAGPGTSTCSPCAGGYFGNSTGATTCFSCPLGKSQERPGQNGCEDCEKGKYASTPAQRYCFLCSQGYYQGEWAQSFCNPCLVGQYTDQAGQTVCAQCAAGHRNPFNGSALCYRCEPGKYTPDEGQINCINTVPGYYQDYEGATQAKICPPGQISTIHGAHACVPCSAGSNQSNAGATSCVECVAGSVAPLRGSQQCTECSIGEYVAFSGQLGCRSCPPGKFSNTSRSTFCYECGLGTFTEIAGLGECLTCSDGYISGIGQSSCTPCPAGMYTFEKIDPVSIAAPCQPCLPGSFSGQAGSASCSACPPGKFTASNQQEECANCAAGRYQMDQGATDCELCGPGTYQDEEGRTECRDCLPGRSSNVTGQTEYGCPSCLPGYYSYFPGQVQCDICDVGSYQNEHRSVGCKPCVEGTYSNILGLDTECPSCKNGTYTSEGMQTSCEVCIPGYFQANEKQAGCDACPPGWYSDSPAAASCLQCDKGYYASESASTTCTRCEVGRAQEPGSTRTSCLDCKPGTFSEGGLEVCIVCAAGTVTNWTRSSKCFQCDPNSDANSQLTECLCNPGYFTYGQEPLRGTNISTIDCIACPDGANCLERGTTFENLGTLPGWWRQDPDELIFTKCTVPDQCQGGRLSNCGPNRGGPGCSICLGRSRSITAVSSCETCPDKEVSLLTTIIIGSITLVFILAIFALVLRADASLHEAAKSHDSMRLQHDAEAHKARKVRALTAHKATTLTDMIHDDIEQSQDTNQQKFDHMLKDWLKDDKASAPPVITDEQRRWNPNVTAKVKIMLGWIQILVNLTYWLDVSWPTFYRFILSYLAVVNMDIVPWQTLECAVDGITFYTKFFTMTLTPVAFFVVLFCLYALPGLIAARWQSHAHARHHSKKYSMRQYHRMVIFLCYLVYPGVSARVMSYFLWKEVNGVKYLRADFKELYKSDEWHQYLYYALGCIAAYPVGIPFFFFVIICRNRHRLLWPATRIRLGLLYASYHDQCWWFETIDMSNKLVLSAAIVFVPAEYSIRIAMLWTGIFLISSLLLNPYIRKGDDRLATLCIVETLLILMSAQLLSGFSANVMDTKADWVLTLFDLSLSGLVVWLFLVQAGRNLKKILVMSREERAKVLDASSASVIGDELDEEDIRDASGAAVDMSPDDEMGAQDEEMFRTGATETGATETGATETGATETGATETGATETGTDTSDAQYQKSLNKVSTQETAQDYDDTDV